MEFRAEARFQRVSPQKVRLVLDLIKGMRVERALDTLAFTKKRIAPDIHKLVRSAVQNATYLSDEKGLDIDVDNLYVVDMTGRVQKFSSNGLFLLSWQMPQTDKGKPKGMSRDREGHIVVLEPH